MAVMKKYSSIPEYLADLDSAAQTKLKSLMQIIREEAPQAEQTFAYGIPTYKLNDKNLLHFAAYKTHIGFYPGSSAVAEFKPELKSFSTSKGTIQFPLDQALPANLIRKITRFCVQSRQQ